MILKSSDSARRMAWWCGGALAFIVGVQVLAQVGSYPALGFDFISSYDYNADEPWDPSPHKVPNTVPASVLALEGQKVGVWGWAMALDFKGGVSSEFVLHSSVDNCMYGGVPRINEWIYVKMAPGHGVKVTRGEEVYVKGIFHIQEKVEKGRVVGLYNMVADGIAR